MIALAADAWICCPLLLKNSSAMQEIASHRPSVQQSSFSVVGIEQRGLQLPADSLLAYPL
jgi:hypothetical protein